MENWKFHQQQQQQQRLRLDRGVESSTCPTSNYTTQNVGTNYIPTFITSTHNLNTIAIFDINFVNDFISLNDQSLTFCVVSHAYVFSILIDTLDSLMQLEVLAKSHNHIQHVRWRLRFIEFYICTLSIRIEVGREKFLRFNSNSKVDCERLISLRQLDPQTH